MGKETENETRKTRKIVKRNPRKAGLIKRSFDETDGQAIRSGNITRNFDRTFPQATGRGKSQEGKTGFEAVSSHRQAWESTTELKALGRVCWHNSRGGRSTRCRPVVPYGQKQNKPGLFANMMTALLRRLEGTPEITIVKEDVLKVLQGILSRCTDYIGSHECTSAGDVHCVCRLQRAS